MTDEPLPLMLALIMPLLTINGLLTPFFDDAISDTDAAICCWAPPDASAERWLRVCRATDMSMITMFGSTSCRHHALMTATGIIAADAPRWCHACPAAVPPITCCCCSIRRHTPLFALLLLIIRPLLISPAIFAIFAHADVFRHIFADITTLYHCLALFFCHYALFSPYRLLSYADGDVQPLLRRHAAAAIFPPISPLRHARRHWLRTTPPRRDIVYLLSHILIFARLLPALQADYCRRRRRCFHCYAEPLFSSPLTIANITFTPHYVHSHYCRQFLPPDDTRRYQPPFSLPPFRHYYLFVHWRHYITTTLFRRYYCLRWITPTEPYLQNHHTNFHHTLTRRQRCRY